MNVQALRLVLLLLVACGPSEEDYVAAARAELARGCCVANDDGRCDKCALLDGAKVVSSRVEDCCANSGKHVILQTAGPTAAPSARSS